MARRKKGRQVDGLLVLDKPTGMSSNAALQHAKRLFGAAKTGHTGSLEAAIKACEAVDEGLAAVRAALEKAGGAMIVTADHGNCETMIDPETGGPHTAHTLNPVPVILVNGPDGAGLRGGGRLADLAPTLLELMGLDQPVEMTGQSLMTR